jgi:gamma-glutamylcyclotransferase (GGCT)/AIG2-like uncharacterized protein YtfP
MKMDKQLPFFVYGTLLPGQPNEYLWGEAVLAKGKAVMKNGRLYDFGHYPMLVEEGDGTVQGMLMFVREETYSDTLTRLDYLEGFEPSQPEESAYRRVVREVWGADGRSQLAWVYIGHSRYVEGLVALEDGNWVHYIENKIIQLNDWWKSIDSVAGKHD